MPSKNILVGTHYCAYFSNIWGNVSLFIKGLIKLHTSVNYLGSIQGWCLVHVVCEPITKCLTTTYYTWGVVRTKGPYWPDGSKWVITTVKEYHPRDFMWHQNKAHTTGLCDLAVTLRWPWPPRRVKKYSRLRKKDVEVWRLVQTIKKQPNCTQNTQKWRV